MPGSMSKRAQPVLHVDELTLRPWALRDVPALVTAYADPAIQHWHTRSMTAAEAEDWVQAANRSWTTETAANWAVTERGAVLGRMAVRSVDLAEGLAGIGYWVVPAARGHAVAPRSLVAVTAWALDELGLHRLELEHSTANEASCRVAQKADYLLESTKRSQALHRDGWHDVHLHTHLNHD